MQYNSTEQTVSWFYQHAKNETLILNPPFQRRPVWTSRQQSHLVESVLLGLPIPEIFIQQKTDPDGNTVHVVVDGQQRISAILKFIGNGADGFELKYLSEESPWRNLGFSDLTEEQRKAFYGRRLAVRMLDNATDQEIKDMFRRLNKYLTPLSDQELRNATYSGPFLKLASSLAEDDFWAENRIVSSANIRRMGDIEFVSELLIGAMHGPQGGSGKIIDDYYVAYEEYQDEFPEQRGVKRLFDRTLDAIQEVLSDIKVTRWHNRTDFYTLFVATSHLLRDSSLQEGRIDDLRKALDEFEQEVNIRLSDENAEISSNAVDYVRALEKGTSDKARRAARHKAILEIISGYFRKRRAV